MPSAGCLSLTSTPSARLPLHNHRRAVVPAWHAGLGKAGQLRMHRLGASPAVLIAGRPPNACLGGGAALPSVQHQHSIYAQLLDCSRWSRRAGKQGQCGHMGIEEKTRRDRELRSSMCEVVSHCLAYGQHLASQPRPSRPHTRLVGCKADAHDGPHHLAILDDLQAGAHYAQKTGHEHWWSLSACDDHSYRDGCTAG